MNLQDNDSKLSAAMDGLQTYLGSYGNTAEYQRDIKANMAETEQLHEEARMIAQLTSGMRNDMQKGVTEIWRSVISCSNRKTMECFMQYRQEAAKAQETRFNMMEQFL